LIQCFNVSDQIRLEHPPAKKSEVFLFFFISIFSDNIFCSFAQLTYNLPEDSTMDADMDAEKEAFIEITERVEEELTRESATTLLRLLEERCPNYLAFEEKETLRVLRLVAGTEAEPVFVYTRINNGRPGAVSLIPGPGTVIEKPKGKEEVPLDLLCGNVDFMGSTLTVDKTVKLQSLGFVLGNERVNGDDVQTVALPIGSNKFVTVKITVPKRQARACDRCGAVGQLFHGSGRTKLCRKCHVSEDEPSSLPEATSLTLERVRLPASSRGSTGPASSRGSTGPATALPSQRGDAGKANGNSTVVVTKPAKQKQKQKRRGDDSDGSDSSSSDGSDSSSDDSDSSSEEEKPPPNKKARKEARKKAKAERFLFSAPTRIPRYVNCGGRLGGGSNPTELGEAFLERRQARIEEKARIEAEARVEEKERKRAEKARKRARNSFSV